MPYPNEHSCRLEDPSLFKDDKFRRVKRKHGNKEYDIIMGIKKSSTSMSEQAYRYNKEEWSEEEAKKHCMEHKGTFEKAEETTKESVHLKEDYFSAAKEVISSLDFSDRQIIAKAVQKIRTNGYEKQHMKENLDYMIELGMGLDRREKDMENYCIYYAYTFFNTVLKDAGSTIHIDRDWLLSHALLVFFYRAPDTRAVHDLYKEVLENYRTASAVGFITFLIGLALGTYWFGFGVVPVLLGFVLSILVSRLRRYDVEKSLEEPSFYETTTHELESKDNIEKITKEYLSKQELVESIRSTVLSMKKLLKKTSTRKSKAVLAKIRQLEPKEENIEVALNMLLAKAKEKERPTEDYINKVLEKTKDIYKYTQKMLDVNKKYKNHVKKDELSFNLAISFMSGVIALNSEEKLIEYEQKYYKNLTSFLSDITVKSFWVYMFGNVFAIFINALSAILMSPVLASSVTPILVFVLISGIVFTYNLIKDVFAKNPEPEAAVDKLSDSTNKKQEQLKFKRSTENNMEKKYSETIGRLSASANKKNNEDIIAFLEQTLNKDKLKALQETSNKAINVIRKYRKKADTPQSRAFFKEMMNNSYDIKGLETAFVEMQKQFKELFDKLSEEDKDNILEETKATYNTILQKLNQDSRYNSTDKEKMAYILALNFMFVYTVNFENGYDRYKLSKVKDNFEYELNRMLLAGSTWECTTAAISFFFALLFFVGTAMSTFPIMLSTSMFGFFVSVFYFITVSFDIIRNAIKNAFKKDEVGSDEDIIDYEELNIFQNKQLKFKRREENNMEKKYSETQEKLTENVRSTVTAMKKLVKKTETPESREVLNEIRKLEPTEENLEVALNMLLEKTKESARPSEEYIAQVLQKTKNIYNITKTKLEKDAKYAGHPRKDELAFHLAISFMAGVTSLNSEEQLIKYEKQFHKNINSFFSEMTIKAFFTYVIGRIVLLFLSGPLVLPLFIFVLINEFVLIYNIVKDIFTRNPEPAVAIGRLSASANKKNNEDIIAFLEQTLKDDNIKDIVIKISKKRK